MASRFFDSIRSNPYYEKAPTQAPPQPATSQSQLRATFTANLESSHGYTAIPSSRRTPAQLSGGLFKTAEVTKWIDFGLRVGLLNGAIGMLVCTFCIKNIQIEQSYTLRLPACIDVLVTAYAIFYRLYSPTELRPSKAAGHYFFNLIIDAGLIPFYVFIALVAKSALKVENTDENAWTSVFSSVGGTERLITATWILSTVVGAIHILAFVLSCILFFIYCRKSRMESASKALESHLTARPPRQKRQYTKTPAKMNGTRVNVRPHNNVTEKSHPVSFMQTRANGDTRYSPHNPQTAVRASRLNLELPALPLGTRTLRTGPPLKSPLPFTTQPRPAIQSFGSSFYSDEEGAPPLPRRSSKRRLSSGLSEAASEFHNGEVYIDENAQPNRGSREKEHGSNTTWSHSATTRASSSISAFDFALPDTYRGAAYRSLPRNSPFSSSEHLSPAPTGPQDKCQSVLSAAQFQPLHMNPPTPPPRLRPMQALGSSSANVRGAKGRLYGDLGFGPDLGDRGTGGMERGTGPHEDQKGRVVSRSGADIAEARLSLYTDDDVDDAFDNKEDVTSYQGAAGVMKAGLRGRIVSGKMAEEGRVDEMVLAEETETLGKSSWTNGSWFKRREL